MVLLIEVFKGKEATQYTSVLSEMRVSEFFNFPYLYVGDVEEDYLVTQAYAASDQGMIVVAFKNNQVAGLFSGMPLRTTGSFLERWCHVLDKNGVDTVNCYYGGELIVQPDFRKEGIGSALMSRLMQEVEVIKYNKIMWVTSIREHDHPLRPQNYFDIDTVCGKVGAKKMNFTITSPYPTRQADGTVKNANNKLACWIKNLA